MHVAAREDVRQRAPDHLADAQLALGRTAAAGNGSCLGHPVHILSRAAGSQGRDRGRRADDGRTDRNRGAGRLRAHGADAGPRGARDAAARLSRRHRAAGAPLDRPRPRRGARRAGRSASSSTDDPLEAFARARPCSTSPRRPRRSLHAELAAQARLVHVVGTTGLERAHLERLAAAARHAVVVRAGNMSVGREPADRDWPGGSRRRSGRTTTSRSSRCTTATRSTRRRAPR